MPVESLTQEDSLELKRLLDIVRGNILAGDRRPWPSGEIADLVQGCTANPAPEVIMVDLNLNNFLMRHRTSVTDGGKDPGPWTGWHIPGGFMPAGMSFRDKIIAICKEDADIGPENIIDIVGVIAIGEWNNPNLSAHHPYGNPLSLPVVVMVDAYAVDVGAGSNRIWCRVKDGMPNGMMNTDGRHEAFLNQFFAWIEAGCKHHVPII